MKTILPTLAALALSASLTFAGELLNVDRAAGHALDGYDPVAFFTDKKPVKGDFKITATHQGAIYFFASLADKYHVIAPDYPGFGHSAMPSVDDFNYTFDNLATVVEEFIDKVGLKRYSIFLMDYGAPVGFRLATKHPERVQALIIQNGNAYDEGLREFWKPIKAYWSDRSETNAAELRKLLTLEATRWQYTHGTRRVESISPDNWLVDQALLDRPGNQGIQLALFYDYGSNPPLYPKWQEYFRRHQPPTLIVWGKNDHIFPADGAHPYRRDLKNVEFHLLDTGHFALEEDGATIAARIRSFLAKQKP
jgi:pimeloyl-ACP methyl ester carboxylesterase